ncbi:hint module-domain-containing protein [Scenedesmus sp. NREL 46B-D3]|nr:hint module-domain-containing protein [Scenedesmus sp. NREL 46B-D3]
MIPAGAVTPQCAASGTVAGVSCVAGAACAWFTWGVCAGFAVPLCAATIVTTAQCIDSKSCFPADGLVHLPDGMVKRMDELAIGDKVLTRATSGAVTYSDVYLLGHQDQFSYTEFVALQLAANKLYLSHGHFIPTASGASCSAENSAACSRVMKRAQDVRVGDLVWAVNAVTGQFDLEVVMKKSIEMRMGLYNPFTLSGDLVVNGVLASAHSDWFLDRVMPQSYVSQIPSIYQTIMSPMRAVYHVGGANAVKYLDANLKVVELASKMSL